MKKTLLILGAALASSVITSQAQVYSQNIVGYINTTVIGGQYNMLNNPFTIGLTNGGNEVFGTQLPDGTQLFQWNGAGFDVSLYDTTIGASTNNWYNGDGSAIAPIPVINPGKGYFLLPPKSFTNIFTGTVVIQTGTSITNHIVGGLYNMVASYLPVGGSVTNTLINFFPPDGTQLFQWSGNSYNVSLYDTTIGANPNNWYNGDGSAIVPIPTVAVGEGYFVLPPSGHSYDWVQSF